MKRNLLALTVLCLIFGLFGCSKSRQEFIIVNESKSDLIVQYTYVDKERIVYKPRVTSAENFEDEGKKWREISKTFFDVDDKYRVVRAKIEPNEAVLLLTLEDYKGSKTKDFPLDMIFLSGSDGEKKYEDKEVQKLFKKQDNGNYVVIYK